MTEYKRLITYVYNYEAGIKKHSVGFARVEQMGEELRIKLEIKVPALSGKSLKFYVYKMIRGGIQAVYVKDVIVNNGSINDRILSSAVNIGDTDLGFHELSGFIIYLSKEKCMVSDWRDQQLTISDIQCIESPITKKVIRETKSAPGDKVSDKSQIEESETTENYKVMKTDLVGETKIVGEYNKAAEKSIETIQAKQSQVGREGKHEEKGEENEYLLKVAQVSQTDILSKAKELVKEIEEEKSNPLNQRKIDDVLLELRNKIAELEEKQKQTTINLGHSVAKDNKERSNINRDEKNGVKQVVIQEIKQEVIQATKHEVLQEIKQEANNEITQEEKQENKEAPINQNSKNIEKGSLEKSNLDVVSLELGRDKIGEGFKSTTEKSISSDESDNEDNDLMEKDVGKEEPVKTLSLSDTNDKEKFPWRDTPAARNIFHSFPHVYPFEDGEIAECVKIEPKDIGMLPMEMWGVGNNSFLLHGYSNYRHLLFAKKQTRNGCIYLLMVPGVYNPREKYMARMFGFEYFKCAKRRNLRDGEFGYWYINVNFENS